MASLADPHYTPEEYLALERAAEYKSEYINGQIYAMAGTSREHNLILGNVFREINTQLRGRPREVYVNDMRVRVSPRGMYTYPDVVVVCGEPQFEDGQVDTLTNPTLIVEVLSPSTEAYDRGMKFAHYRKLTSLTDYVLVSQERPLVEHFARQGDSQDQWLLTANSDLDRRLRLTSIGCELTLEDIYDRVSFPEVESGTLGLEA